MARWLAVSFLLGGLVLAGCGEGSRVERRPLVVAEGKPSDGPPGPGPAEPSPHGMSLPKGHPSIADAPPAQGKPGPGEKPDRQSPEVDLTSNEVKLDRIELTAPKAWVRKPPRSQFVQAEFSLPRAEGDAQDGRLTVSQAGGSIEANVERWQKQFGEKPEKASQEKLTISGVPVTTVDLSGTFQDQAGPFAPAVERSGSRMLGAIADLGGQLYFIKAYGPAKTMAAHAAEFRQFLDSLKKTAGPKAE